jgi:hypothetical protein
MILLLLSGGGLAQLCYGARDAWLRSVARRNRISVPSLGGTDSTAGDRRLAIAAKSRPGGGTVFVVSRYRIDGQYGIPAPAQDTVHG